MECNRVFNLEEVSNIEEIFQSYSEVDEYCFDLSSKAKVKKLEEIVSKRAHAPHGLDSNNYVFFFFKGKEIAETIGQKEEESLSRKKVSIVDRALLEYWKGRLSHLTDRADARVKKFLKSA